MARVFITGSSDGLGLMVAQMLVEQGHTVVLHARNEQRADQTRQKLPAAEAVLIADLSSIRQTRDLAEQANATGAFDAIIHNAAIGYREPKRNMTEDGLSQLFAINSLAPYLLTARMRVPKRLVYVSSGLHLQGDPTLRDLNWETRPWSGQQAYSDSKLHNVLLAFAVSHRWPAVLSNAMTPGWVQTKMGGPGASDDLQQGHLTQVWLATSPDAAANVSGRYFYHLRESKVLPAAQRQDLQEQFLAECERLTGDRLPESAGS